MEDKTALRIAGIWYLISYLVCVTLFMIYDPDRGTIKIVGNVLLSFAISFLSVLICAIILQIYEDCIEPYCQKKDNQMIASDVSINV
jgi:hypothetical protein